MFPERKITTFEIPGRNGTQIIDQEVYANYNQSYDVFFDVKKYGGLNAALPQIASWLLSGNGYQRLEDSYFPDFYRLAYVSNGHEFLSYFQEYGRGTITFNCMPERFYKSGEYELEIQNGQTLYNPTNFKAYPLISLKLSGNVTLKLTENGTTRSVTFNTNGTYDVKNRRITSTSSNTNSALSGINFDNLVLGKETKIEWTGSVTSLTIKPNWWTI